MSNDTFPKRRNTDVTAEKGVNIVSTIFNDQLGWVFRRTHEEHDFGVDAYVDYVTKDGCVTGQFLAVQIKTGKSYLSKHGTMHWYSDTKEHLNYFLNLPTPILLIICDPDTGECFWALLKKEEVDFKESRWRYPIPKKQKLSIKSISEIENILGVPEDHLEEFEEDNQLLDLVNSDTYIQYCVPREDIESKSLDNLKEFLNRITRNEKLTNSVQGKLYISTYGYENDSREVFQISAIRKWAKKARKKINCWYLCASGGEIPSTITWLGASTCNIDSKPVIQSGGTHGYEISGIPKEWSEFISECFHGLNIASDKWGWPVRKNYEISKLIQKELFPDIPFPELDEAPNKS